MNNGSATGRPTSHSLTIIKNLTNSSNSDFKIAEAQGLPQTKALRIENQTKIFASMCPDEILDYYDSYETRGYYTVLMLGDVSGFTEMAEKFTKSGKGGPSKLTDTLNSYIGAMVQEILSHNGDVLKFSGDAFIVMWKLPENRVMRDIASEAIRTACIIQKHFGTYETEVDVVLKVKLSIASGKIYFTSIGHADSASYYIITGKPVWEVKYAETLCRGGDILVAQSCWQWVNPNEYIFEVLPDGIHTLIISLSVLWENLKETYSTDILGKMSSTSSESSINSNVMSDSGLSTATLPSSLFYRKTDETETTDYSLRPKVVKAAKARVNKQLRSYILRPVIRSVEMDEPLEYLTEIRQVVIVFVNVITNAMNRKTLIKLVNATFLFVCNTVGDMQGCVNKTSLFDKDLIFLCIFGLRGDKHELESQIGLRCASKLRRGLLKFANIKSVTVGVTTGMTYCGVVGHVLRREYTVIGMAVNKAARLMCAYVNKVVCDRESYLLSHLEAKHFILQEAKILKGISTVGPVYEFAEQSEPSVHDLSVNKYPILGRDEELKIFHDMLDEMLNSRLQSDHDEGNDNDPMKSNIMIIRGEPRVGKTRLLEEMMHIAPAYIPMNFISLAVFDKQHPYILLRLFFSVQLEIVEETPLKLKQEKISSRFPDKDSWRLCALNDVFNVSFQMSSDFVKLDEKARRKNLKQLLGRMTRNCFRDLWVIIIDDAELADEESLALFHVITNQKIAFFVLSYGNKLSKPYVIPHHLKKNARIVDLAGLNKWYHAAFACHVMDVVAIPVELENVIQEKSAGNPGWIESYLISLLQSTGLVLKNLTKLQIHNLGLVSPPEKLLIRYVNAPMYEIPSDPVTSKRRRNGWRMYQSSFRESFSKNDAEHAQGDYDDLSIYSVCTLSSNFVLEDVDSLTAMNTILLKLYDSLTPLDQYLLKCAVILGEIVDRKMLEKLMEGTPQRDIGTSVVKLFELRVVGCAVGDFSRSPGPSLSFKRILDPSAKMQIRCGCIGIEIPKALEDLPRYAACGLMRFQLAMFRETTYRLLTENQKVEFHSKALRYLQQNTRRCVSCGGGHFNKLLGHCAMRESRKKTVSEVHDELRLSVVSDGDRKTSRVSSSAMNYEYGGQSSSTSSLELFKMCRPMVRSPTRTFSNIDFTNCDCNSILLTAYTHVMEHCRGIGVKELLLVGILEFIEVCISTFNIPQARKLLAEGDELVDAIYSTTEDEKIVLPYLKGKILTLSGRCYLERGVIFDAMKCFEAATKIMGYKFPSNLVMIRMKSSYLLKQQQLMLTCLRPFTVGSLEGDAANYNDQFASCLAQMFIVYRMKGMNEHAKLAAIWALNVALRSHKDFFVLCTSYSNMIITSHDYQYKSLIPFLETDAINLCDQRKESVELQELIAVAELYTRIFVSRWMRGMVDKATSIGFVAARQAHAIKSVSLKLMVLPRLIQVLVMQCRYGEVVSMLRELEFVSQNDLDQSGYTWYYSLSMDLLLESGISNVTRLECEQFYQQESCKILNLRDSEAAKRLFVVMWLWYVRIGDWEAATVWRTRKCDTRNVIDLSVLTGVTALKKLEGLIICYVFKLDNKNSTDAVTVHSEIKNTFKMIKKVLKVVKPLMPRFLLIKAYYEMVMLRKNYSMTLLQRSKEISRDRRNTLIYNWAEHCEKSWSGSLSAIQQDFWKEQCAVDKQVDWHEVDLQNRKILPYTLPLPKTHQIQHAVVQ